MPLLGPSMKRRGPRTAWTVAALVAAAAGLSACAYSYDDGLPPLGERSTPSSAPPAQTLRPLPAPAATDPPLRDWTPDMVASWAEAALPDQKGLSFGFGYGIVLEGEPVVSSSAVPAGTITLEYECRGGPAAHLSLELGGMAVVDADYACGQVWVRTFVAPQDSVADVTSSAVAGSAAAYVYRVVKR
ncbi:hypothetical protein [Sinomonas susongensis]|uniref:hypothetical protein n=1 Tax=Sinomonas susongensis TaxID=1324851 RepID=UPI0011098419|nr:hypothetical protein [Sinomonas susongensis]